MKVPGQKDRNEQTQNNDKGVRMENDDITFIIF